jgi:UDP-N-acetylglucosamine 2-epimerase (non-hydrolysing)
VALRSDQGARLIAVVLGTRPELIKTAPVIHALRRRGAPFAILHTGQHYTKTLDEIFFTELDLPQPLVQLGVGSMHPAKQVAAILSGMADALEELKPKWVLVQGDTNSVLGGALAAHKCGIPVAHLEAGLRSDDWTMPEEGNRVLAGRVAAAHFCPTATQANRLAAEGITRGVYVVGNTIVDATMMFAARAATESTVLARLGIEGRPYALLTLHRPSNVDDPARLTRLVHALAELARQLGLALVFPVHPRTHARLVAASLADDVARAPFLVTEPVGYLDMLRLLRGASVALTDSGGVQEEACTLKVPCITLRANTERPETVDVGANVLCDAVEAEPLVTCARGIMARDRGWKNPFGDGKAGERVAGILLDPSTSTLPSGAPVPAP